MTRSTLALILTSMSALIAHLSVYVDSVYSKYSISAVGAVLAIIGGITLFTLRKPFRREYLRKDLDIVGVQKPEYQLRIDYSLHRKKSPTVTLEYLSGVTWRRLEDIIIAHVLDSEDDVILATVMLDKDVRDLNFDHLDRIRVTIK